MFGTKEARAGIERSAVLFFGFVQAAEFAQYEGEIGVAAEGVGVLGPQHVADGPRALSGGEILPGPVGQVEQTCGVVIACCQGLGVFSSEDASHAFHRHARRGFGFVQPAELPQNYGVAALADKGFGVLGAEAGEVLLVGPAIGLGTDGVEALVVRGRRKSLGLARVRVGQRGGQGCGVGSTVAGATPALVDVRGDAGAAAGEVQGYGCPALAQLWCP
ncbi:hypothetical protein OIE54_01020 [Streptomyces sp. NBC_01794]|nr:hypothetical protein [Streptomyces sp. NBC_01750]WSA97968.1 hypothetical protein OIE54_01020 [Streptomyces sp. NBC_01794]WSD37479.1 hypothetical protein OG966_39665 [Streptomyces sp. NBC_01750]